MLARKGYGEGLALKVVRDALAAEAESADDADPGSWHGPGGPDPWE
jgi:regulatory protein